MDYLPIQKCPRCGGEFQPHVPTCLDCGAATTPEQAMQCCSSMKCSAHGHHGQDCCKPMSAMHAPFVQPSSVHVVFYSVLVFTLLPATRVSHTLGSSNGVTAANFHAPPIPYTPAPPPLRI